MHVFTGKNTLRAPPQVTPTPHSLNSQANMTVARVRHAAVYLTLVVLATVGVIPRVGAFNGGLRAALTRPHDGSAAASSASIVGPSSRNAGMLPAAGFVREEGWLPTQEPSSACHGQRERCCRVVRYGVWMSCNKVVE